MTWRVGVVNMRGDQRLCPQSKYGCGKWKHVSEFSVDKTNPQGYRTYCRECVNRAARERFHRNKEKYRDMNRRLKFGIAPGTYALMFNAQAGLCALCGEPEKSVDKRFGKVRDLAVDHNHQTGQVRELLCQACNHGIGAMRDSPELLRRAAAYIERHNSS